MPRRDAEAALARYLGTRLLGSWVAYQGTGLRSVLASLVAAYALAAQALAATTSEVVTIGRMTSAIRAADWLVLHLLDRQDFARYCSEFETDAGGARLLQLTASSAAALDVQRWAA